MILSINEGGRWSIRETERERAREDEKEREESERRERVFCMSELMWFTDGQR